jgi:alpha-2-macroglobulin
MLNRFVFCCVPVFTLLFTACGGGKLDVDHRAQKGRPKATPPKKAAPKVALIYHLSEGKVAPKKASPKTSPKTVEARSPATALSKKRTQALLKRLPALRPADERAFALRKSSQKAPRPGKTIQGIFPPPVHKKAPDQARQREPLKVLRYAPEGPVKIGANISVTFSQPMVAISSTEETLVKGVPLKFKPKVEGVFRWVGTRTLLFAPKTRLPMATRFEARIPAGTRSATGGTLKTEKSWTFQTPPPRLVSRYPQGGSHGLEPLLFLSFDQRIAPKALLKSLTLSGPGTRALRIATKAEVAQHEKVRQLASGAMEGRWVALALDRPLQPAGSYRVDVATGLSSLEGPEKTTEVQSYSFETYEALTVKRTNGDRSKLSPLSSMSITFNNALDEELFEEEAIVVTPQPKGLRLHLRGRYLRIGGQTAGRQTYTVRLPASLTDIYGQRLGTARKVEFRYRGARPRLWGSRGRMQVIDPNGDKAFRFKTINFDKVRLRVYRVDPSDWPAFEKSYNGGLRRVADAVPPGKLLEDKILRIRGNEDAMTETAVPLKPYLNEAGHGQLVVLVEKQPQEEKPWRRTYVLSWQQITDLAVDAFSDHKAITAWTTRLQDGKPVKGAAISAKGLGGAAKSDSRGLAKIPFGEGKEAYALVARTKDDQVFLLANGSSWGRPRFRKKAAPTRQLTYFVFDDRNLYRPKEKARFKGWVRWVGPRQGVSLLSTSIKSLPFVVKDSRGNKVASGHAGLGPTGGFDINIPLPDTMNLGYAKLTIKPPSDFPRGRPHQHKFRVQEFKRPEFEVTTTASPGPHYVGKSATVSLKARYFAGGGLAGTPVRWRLATTRAHYSPPNADGYTFVGWRPSWFNNRKAVLQKSKRFKGQTDGKGDHHLNIDFESMGMPQPVSIRASGTITDLNRQAWTASKALLVHPSANYVGLKTKRYFIKRGEPLKVTSIVVDLAGKRVSGRPVTMTASRLQYRYRKGKWLSAEVEKQTCELTSAETPKECLFKSDTGGTYLIAAEVRDAHGRLSRTEMMRWVSGGTSPPRRNVEKEAVPLIADKTEYSPGDKAEILVQAPFFPAEGLLTVRRRGIVEERRFSMTEATTTLVVPLTAAHYPSLKVQVDLLGSAPRLTAKGETDSKLQRRPAFASGIVSLSIPPRDKALTVEAKLEKQTVAPGAQANITLVVTDAQGRPVRDSEIALVVVDEAVLALNGYRIRNPLSTFYPRRADGVTNSYLRQFVRLALTKELQAPGGPGDSEAEQDEGARDRSPKKALPPPSPGPPTTGASQRKGLLNRNGRAKKSAPIALRKDFAALAHFAPSLRTDANGHVRVKFKVPDSLTRYRVSAIAVAGSEYYGKVETTLTARRPLMVRPAAPRFLNYGDKFQLAFLLQNQTSTPMQAEVAVRGSNIRILGAQGKGVSVAANDRVEVRFNAESVKAGQANLQVAVASGAFADAAILSIPVWTPATSEAFATYGVIDQGSIRQPLRMPRGVVPSFGGVEVNTSSTALSALTDALLYLYSYPFECAEQTSSRILAVAALRDVLTAFKAKGLPPPRQITAALDRDVMKLAGLQNIDGGFPFWRRGHRSWPFLSVHVTHALVRAKDKGFTLPPKMFRRALNHLKRIRAYIPSTYPAGVRRAIIAYSLYVRHRAKDSDVKQARALYAELAGLKDIPLEAIAWLYPVLSASAKAQDETLAIRKILANRVSETAAAAHFRSSYTDGAYLLLHSTRRIDALLLEGLIADQPKSDLIAKIVRGLLAHRKQGRWGSTQENAWVLLALDKYFNTYEKVSPNFVAQVWLGKGFAGEQRFSGRSAKKHQISIPMSYLATVTPPGNTADFVLRKNGPGRLYYRLGMRYAPANLKVPPASHGFSVRRRYEAVDNDDDLRRDKDGKWHAKAGARIRVRVTMVAPARRYHVALVDPLPAGLEPVNPDLAGSERIPPTPSTATKGRSRGRGMLHRRYSWRRQWYEHQNLRDERAEAFSSLLAAGVHEYSYVARATTLGTFVVPPPKAEEMYHPETFGRGPGELFVVE